MNSTRTRRCRECSHALSKDARSNRKYCSDACQRRAASRRFRAKHIPERATAHSRIEQLQDELDESKTYANKLARRLADRDTTIRRLEHALKRAEHQVEVAASEQAERTYAVRQRLAVANSEVVELKRNWTARSQAADTTGQENGRLREQLATLTGQYNDLVAKYRELSASAERAATERKQLQGLVRQWDAMCVRLYKATGGRPRKESDKKILATWTQFRKAVRT